MKNLLLTSLLVACGLLAPLALPLPAQAQTPFTVTTLSPARNARTAALTTPVGVTFSAPLNAATAGNIRVFSQQYRGRRTATASTSGATATLTPTVPATGLPVAGFKPGETLFVTVPATVQSTGGAAAVMQVYQFTAAAGGTGGGNFVAPATNPEPTVGSGPNSVAVGDVDGDGDLDSHGQPRGQHGERAAQRRDGPLHGPGHQPRARRGLQYYQGYSQETENIAR